MHTPTMRQLRQAGRSWLDDVDEDVIALWAMIAVMLLLMIACLIARANAGDMGLETATGDDYERLRVVIFARGHEAELEVDTDSFQSYEDLREHVVAALPELFQQTDELTLEYQNRPKKPWIRVKLRTRIATVKSAHCLRITAEASRR